jgi:hypothetical protein
LLVALAVAAAGGLVLPGVVPANGVDARCASSGLTATFTLVPGSQGAGQIGYALTITNVGRGSCTLAGTPALTLLSAGRTLPTAARTYPGGAYTVALAAGQWAQAAVTFTPDIAAADEPGNRCEPIADSLRLSMPAGGGTLDAPMDPTMVCQHGRMAISRLKAVPRTPACTAGSLAAAFKAVGPPYGGAVIYALTLRNGGTHACAVIGTPGLALRSASGHALGTEVQTPVSYPYVIAHGQLATLDANAYTRHGPGEPASGPCEPPASELVVTLPRSGGRLTTALQPPRSFCHHGYVGVSGLFLNG